MERELKAEPVAWRFRIKGDDLWHITKQDPRPASDCDVQPLYAHPAPQVKALEWEHGHTFAGQPCSYAETVFGAWMMVAYAGRGGRWAYDDGNGEASEDDWLTREDCEAAAQVDYAARILSTLSGEAQR